MSDRPASEFAGMRARLAEADQAEQEMREKTLAEPIPESGVCLPGMPIGLRAMRFASPQPGDYFLQGNVIQRAAPDANGCSYAPFLIVEAAPGYELRPNPPYGDYEILAPFPRPRKLLAIVEVNDSLELERAVKALNAIPGLKALSNLP